LIHEDAVAAEANDYFKCTKDGGHGRLALQRALAVSCNVFFYTMHGRLPAASLVRTAHRLGLTERCGLSGRGGAEPVHPLPGTHLRRILFPVGHGCQTTPLAAAVFLNAILNDGHVLEPQVLPADGRVARQVRRVVRPLEPFFLLRRAMREAVMTGTAAAAGRELRVPLGGKTGSGIRGNDVFRLDGWFLSYAPAEAPRILLVAVTTGSAGNGLPLANSVRFYRGLEQRGFFSKQR
jgi:penicillin-binding protein 2